MSNHCSWLITQKWWLVAALTGTPHSLLLWNNVNDDYTLKKLVSFPCPAISFFLLEALLTLLPGLLTDTLGGCFFSGGSFSDPPCWSESTCFLLLPLLCIWLWAVFLLPWPAPVFWAFPLLGPRAAPCRTPLCALFGLLEVGLAGKSETKQKQVWQPGRGKKKGDCDEIVDVNC